MIIYKAGHIPLLNSFKNAIFRRELSVTDIALYLAITSYTRGRHGSVDVSDRGLCSLARITKQQLKQARAKLIASGHIAAWATDMRLGRYEYQILESGDQTNDAKAETGDDDTDAVITPAEVMRPSIPILIPILSRRRPSV